MLCPKLKKNLQLNNQTIKYCTILFVASTVLWFLIPTVQATQTVKIYVYLDNGSLYNFGNYGTLILYDLNWNYVTEGTISNGYTTINVSPGSYNWEVYSGGALVGAGIITISNSTTYSIRLDSDFTGMMTVSELYVDDTSGNHWPGAYVELLRWSSQLGRYVIVGIDPAQRGPSNTYIRTDSYGLARFSHTSRPTGYYRIDVYRDNPESNPGSFVYGIGYSLKKTGYDGSFIVHPYSLGKSSKHSIPSQTIGLLGNWFKNNELWFVDAMTASTGNSMFYRAVYSKAKVEIYLIHVSGADFDLFLLDKYGNVLASSETSGQEKVSYTIKSYDQYYVEIFAKSKLSSAWYEDNMFYLYIKLQPVYSLIVQTPYSNIWVKIDGTTYNTDSSGKVSVAVESGSHTIELQPQVSIGTGSRSIFEKWSDGQTSNPRTISIKDDITLTAQYKTQYQAIFQQSGSESSPHVTVDGTEYSLPQSFWFDSGSSHSFSYESQVSGGAGVQYLLKSISHASPIIVLQPITITGYYKTQYYLKISAEPNSLPQPTASPTGPWYDEGTIVTLTAQTVSGYEFEGWTLDGSQLTGNPIFVTMNSPHTAVAKYFLTTILNPSSITCRVSSPSIQTGSSIKVSGSITPVHSRITVTLAYTKPDGSTLNRTVLTDSLGTYSDSYVPDFAGLWSVQASWAGDSDHAPAESEVVSFAVGASLQSLRVSISRNGTELYNGDVVSFTITIGDENGNPIDPDSLSATYDSISVQPTRTSLGNYTYAQRLLSGLHTLSVVASKSGYIQGINTETISVKKAKVSLDLLVSQERVVTGEKIEIKGTLKPSIENVAVLLTFYGPNNRTETEEATTDSKGSFKLVFLPKDSGLWRVKARFFGDAEHEEAESEATFLAEEEKPSQQVEQPSGLGMSEVLNIVLAVVVIMFLIILVKGGKKKMPKLLSTALTPVAQTDYLTRLRTEIAKLTAELALLGFALAALSWTICWIIIILPYTPRRYKEWAFEHRVSILEATFWFGTFNAIVSIILWVVSFGG